MLIDTNILFYAMNKDSIHHEVCRAFVESQRQSRGFFLTWSIVYEFLRIVTHPKILAKPLKAHTAHQAILTLIEDPSVDVLVETVHHERFLNQILESIPAPQGNLFHDVHIASIMLEHGIRIIATADRHFRLFPSLKIIDPTESSA